MKQQYTKSRARRAKEILDALHKLSLEMSFDIEGTNGKFNRDTTDPEIIRSVFYLPNNSREALFKLLDELRESGIHYSFIVKQHDDENYAPAAIENLDRLKRSPAKSPDAGYWRKLFFQQLKVATRNAKVKIEFQPYEGNCGDSLGEINFVAVLTPGLLEKFTYSANELSKLGAQGIIALRESPA